MKKSVQIAQWYAMTGRAGPRKQNHIKYTTPSTGIPETSIQRHVHFARVLFLSCIRNDPIYFL